MPYTLQKACQMDETDDDLTPINSSAPAKSTTAVAINAPENKDSLPVITASGRGALAERILRLAFDNGVRVREDKDLADMLARIDIDSPVPTQALLAVAEILSYVYRANGEADPFNAVLDEVTAPMILDGEDNNA